MPVCAAGGARRGVRVGAHLLRWLVPASSLAPSRPVRLGEASCQRKRNGRRAGESVRTCARRADPRGQRRGVRRAARQAAASRSVPSRNETGSAEGWASRAGGEGNGVPGQRAEEQKPQQAANPRIHHPDLGGTLLGHEHIQTSNQPHLTINSHVSLNQKMSYYIT